MDTLNKLFNIRPTEWPRVLLLLLMASLSNVGGVWGSTITYAAFLKQPGGLELLPWVLVSSSVLSILAIAIYTAFVDHLANDRLLVALYAIGTAIIIIILGLALLGLNPLIAYPLLYLLFLTWLAVVNPHFITYVNGFYDIQAAKRVLPVVSAGFRVGVIVAGLSMPFLTSEFEPETILVIWLLIYMVIAGLAWSMPYFLKERGTQVRQAAYTSPVATPSSEKQRSSYLDNMREGFRYTVQSTFLRWMAIGTLLLMVLMALIEYKTGELLLKEMERFGTQEELANFLAFLAGVGTIFVLPMLLFGMSHLITRLGLGNTSLIFPAGNLMVCGGLVLAPGLVSAAAAYLDRVSFRPGFQSPIDGLLYNAVPLRVKGRARAFVSGLIVPVGTLMGGLLLVLPSTSAVPWFVPTLIAGLAVAYLVSSLFIRQQYSQALVKMLGQEDYSFLLSQEASDLTVADPSTLGQLQKKLQDSTSHEFTIFMAKLISQIGGDQAVPILRQTARAAAGAQTRSALVDVLVAAGLRGDAVRQLYIEFLGDPHGRVRQSAVTGLEHLAGLADKQILSRMLEMVHDPDMNVRVRVLVALVHSGNFYQLAPAVQSLDQLLADEDPHCRARGIQVVREIANHRAIRDLMEYLSDPADEVRLEAALAVEELSRGAIPQLSGAGCRIDAPLVEKMTPLLRDPVERVRQAALLVLGRIGTRESHQMMVDALADSSSQVRETAVDALAQAGKSIIPVVHPKLNSPDAQLRKMAAVTLSRVNPREFGSLIVGSNITGNLLTIYRNYGLAEALVPCAEHLSLAILQSALREQNRQLLDEIFYLLTAIYAPDDVKIIGESLRSESARVRANATEALEALTTPQIACLIAPLFEPDLPPIQLLSLSEETWDMEHPDTARAIRQLVANPDDPWLRAITAFALGEIGAALSAGEKKSPPGCTSLSRKRSQLFLEGPAADDTAGRLERPRRRRSPPADLLGVVMGTCDDSETSSEAPHRRDEEDLQAKASSQPPYQDTSPGEAERGKEMDEPSALLQAGFTLPEIEAMLEASLADPVDEVRLAAQSARRVMAAGNLQASFRMADVAKKEAVLLATLERIIFLKQVPFFQGMTVDQLKILASVCEEEFFEADMRIFDEGDPGGALYVVVSGRVGIEREKRKGSFVRVATLEAHSYFGETTLFDNGPRTAAAIAVQDSLTLRLRREPLIALARQYPDLSLELINVLSKRLSEANDRIAELTRTRPRQLQKLFDQLD
jgi:CRP-like cAMP-binding protein/HEAT repeat protein